MKPHPRIRKTIKYGGAALTALLVALWIASTRCAISRHSVTTTHIRVFSIAVGGISWSTYAIPGGTQLLGTPHWTMLQIPFQHHWGFFATSAWAGSRETSIAIWPLVLITGSLSAWAFRLDTLARRRERMNLCKKCGYDRTGLAPTAVCPECGSGSNGGSPA